MGSVTPTVVPGEGYVRVEANWQDVSHTRRVWIYRTVNGVDTKLRDGDNAWLSNGIAVAFDHEAPLDTVLTYKSAIPLNYSGDFEGGVTEWQDATNSGTVGTVTQSLDYYVPGTGNASAKLTPSGAATSKGVSELVPIAREAVNANPYFETNATDWSGVGGATVARSTAQFHEGAASLLITPDGVTSAAGAQSGTYACVAGQTYGYSAWLRVAPAGSGTRIVGVAFYNGASFLSTVSQSLTPTPGTWTFYSGTAVAPATANLMRFVTQGSGVLAAANTWNVDEAVLVDPSQQVTYTLTGNLLISDYWTGGLGVQLQWYSDTTTLISTSGAMADVTPFPGTWLAYSLTATAPPGANGVRLVFGATGSPPASLLVYADELYLTRTGSTVSSAPVVVPSSGGGWWTDPLHPATKVRLQVDLAYTGDCSGLSLVAYLGVGEETFPADSVALDVNDAVLPVAAYQRRKGGRQEMRVGTATLADLARVQALHAPGAPLLLQLPPAYGEADAYQLHGDLVVPRINGDQRVPWRIASSSFVKTAAPVGPAEGTFRTRYVDLGRYTTFAAATSAGVTWLDALRGNLAP